MLRRLNPFSFKYLSRSDFRRVMVGMVSFSLVVMLGMIHPPLLAQTSVNQARISEILDGDQVYIQTNRARVNDQANRGQRVSTGAARAQLNFNTGAVARLSPNSVLTVGQCAQLQRGVLLVNGAANGCTASVTAGVRGTTYVLEVDETGQEQIKVLEGEVVVTRQDHPVDETEHPTESPNDSSAPSQPTQPSTLPAASAESTSGDGSDGDEQVILQAGQRISTRRGERLGLVQQLTAQDFIDILTGQLFEGFLEQLPGMDRIQSSFQQLFPNVPFPLSAPSIPIPRPRLPF